MENLNTTLTTLLSTRSAPSFDGFPTPEDLEKALWEAKLKTLNEVSAPANGFDCPLCRNKGVTYRLREETGRPVATPCKCTAIRSCIARMRESGLGDALEKLTFDTFRADTPWRGQLLRTAKGYAENPKGWLTMLGQSGCGKTHLCTAVCGQLLKAGKAVSYFSWREESARLKAASPERREELLSVYLDAPYLYIDDLFKTGRGPEGLCQPTAGDLNLAFTILGHRYSGQKPTILSSEYSIQELLLLDEAIGSRIAELSGPNLCAVRKDPAKNYRLRAIREM